MEKSMLLIRKPVSSPAAASGMALLILKAQD